jgi:heat shock protein HslJ
MALSHRLPRLSRVTLSLIVFHVTTAAASQPPQAAGPPLAGTAWQLVRFQGGDGKVLTPDDPSKYTVAFDNNGNLTARVDCNRGRGTWTSSGPGNLQFSPMALTRAMCPPGSLHDQIARQWTNIRSYVMKGGHLFLSLMADGVSTSSNRPRHNRARSSHPSPRKARSPGPVGRAQRGRTRCGSRSTKPSPRWCCSNALASHGPRSR